MRRTRWIWFGLFFAVAGGFGGCGSTNAGRGEGEYCDRTSDCQTGLECKNHVCQKPAAECRPPCGENEMCVDGVCKPIQPVRDQDGDGVGSDRDCDDLDPLTHPADEAQGIPAGFEYCDGRDNDCDGSTDEDCPPCAEDAVQDCGTDVGECTPGVQRCRGGAWEACSGQGPVAEVPDGKDNDCDGATDEGMPCTAGQTHACGGTVGVCTAGVQECQDGFFSECRGGVNPGAERCNGLDDDCDGLTDDGFMTGQACDGRGECGAGVIECAADFGLRCSTEPGGSRDQSRPERCNGRDDACDGETDEDFRIGQPCLGTGMCGNGVWECGGEEAARCSTDPGGSRDQSQAERCDGLDNDCDGSSDEDFFVGTACDGLGECGAGTIECASTTTTRCSTEPGGSADQSRPELCDGLDDDCDGESDDGFGIGQACDGVGECGVGVIECATTSATRCSTDAGGTQDQSRAEQCNGWDDDCDGSTDNGDDQALCQPLPDHVVRATCARPAGACQVANPLSDCDRGWWDFNGVWADGCEVRLDNGADVGNTCAAAAALDTLSDAAAGSQITVSGNLVPAGDEDWYRVLGFDDIASDETVDQCDNYHFKVRFGQKPAGVVFDVSLDSCTEMGCRQEICYDFRTNFRDVSGSTPLGECGCRMSNTAGYNLCEQKHHTYYIRVYRQPGYAVTADPYTLTISNGNISGGVTCP